MNKPGNPEVVIPQTGGSIYFNRTAISTVRPDHDAPVPADSKTGIQPAEKQPYQIKSVEDLMKGPERTHATTPQTVKDTRDAILAGLKNRK